MRLGSALLAACALLSACGGDGGELFVEVRTDLAPGVEFQTVRTVVTVASDTRTVTVRAAALDDYINGARVAELGSLAAGDATVDVTLLDSSDQTVATRRTRLALSGAQSMTVVITRSCRDVICGDEQTCQGGGCVDVRCSPDNPEACGTAECAMDSECTATGACAGATCAEGVCLQVPDDARCAAGERCSLDDGCVVAPPDAGPDAAMDAGRDSAVDSAVDSAAPDTSGVDSGVDAGSPLTMPFGPATPVTVLNSASTDDDPTLSTDMREIFFASTRVGGVTDIYTATRASAADPWNAPVPVDDINTPGPEANPMLSRDGRTLYFGRGSRVWQSRRSGPGATWEAPTEIDELSLGAYTACPAPAADHLSIIICVQEAGAFALYRSERASAGATWGPPQIVPSLGSDYNDVNGYFGLPGGRLFFFTSDRPGAGMRDLWYATRPSDAAPFDAPVPVPGVNTAVDDENPWISDDLRTIYFASERDGPFNIYMATR